MKTYKCFIQPVLNMKMWPESQNISVIPPEFRKMPGRPKKARKKEEGESKKTGKLSKRGLEMSCSTCHNKGHNKRKCPLGASTGPSAAPVSSGPTTAHISTGPSVVPVSAGPSSIGPTVAPVSAANPITAGPTRRGRGRPKGSTEKGAATKTRMVGMGVLHTQSGATIINPGMSSERFRNVKSSTFVTGDHGYKSTSGVKWKGKQAMTSSELQRIRGRNQVETRSKAAHLSQESSNDQYH